MEYRRLPSGAYEVVADNGKRLALCHTPDEARRFIVRARKKGRSRRKVGKRKLPPQTQ